MLRYAFIINLPGVTPKTYSAVYKNEESYCMVAGVDGAEMGKKFVQKLLTKDFTTINLCSDFSEKTVAEIREMAGENVRVRHAQYTVDGLIKLDFTRSFRKYGIIVVVGGVKKAAEYLLKSDKRDTRVIFAGNIRQAKSAAKRMVEKQVNYIELSCWFDRMRMDSVVRAINHTVAVGTCGDLTMRELVDYPPDEPERVVANLKKSAMFT